MKSLRKKLAIVQLFVKNSAMHRANIITGAVIFSVYIFVFASLWEYMGSDVQVAGYSLQQMIWYLICTEFIMVACRTNIFSQITMDVKSGNIAYLVNRPVNYISYNLASSFGGNLISVMIYAVISVCLGVALSSSLPSLTLSAVLPVLLSLLLGIFIQLYMQVCIGLSALYLGESTAVFLIYQKLVFLLGGFLPTTILPQWLQKLSALLPFQYVAGVPAKLFVSFSWTDFFQLVGAQVIYLGIIVLFTMALTKRGMRKLQIYGG